MSDFTITGDDCIQFDNILRDMDHRLVRDGDGNLLNFGCNQPMRFSKPNLYEELDSDTMRLLDNMEQELEEWEQENV